jgi:hypothetical protein
MEILVTIISLTLLGGLLLSPIFLLRFLNRANIKYKFIAYLTLGFFLTAFIAFVFAWWGDISDKLLLAHYGYSFEGWSDKDYYENVAPENMERVKTLVTSMMGIGWPLKAIMTYMFYSPYLLVVYVGTYLIRKKIKIQNLTILV